MKNTNQKRNTRIAIISDVHGNYSALKAVISDIKKKEVDLIYCLGDIVAKGVNARKCIDLVKKECHVVLKGNTDDRFTTNPCLFKDDEVEYGRLIYHQQFFDQEDFQYLKNLPIYTEICLSGNLIRLFHASPDDVYKTIDNYDLDFTKKLSLFEAPEGADSICADIVVFGHLHYQFMEKLYGKTLINCGSVGCSGCPVLDETVDYNAEISNAHYLIITGSLNESNNTNISFSFESVPYDKEIEISDSRAAKNIDPDYENLLKKAYYPGLSRVMKRFLDRGYKLKK